MAEQAAIAATTRGSLQETATIRYTSASISFRDASKTFQKLIYNRLNKIGLEMATPDSDVHLPSGIIIKAADKNTPGALFIISQETEQQRQVSESNMMLSNGMRELEKTLEKMI